MSVRIINIYPSIGICKYTVGWGDKRDLLNFNETINLPHLLSFEEISRNFVKGNFSKCCEFRYFSLFNVFLATGGGFLLCPEILQCTQ